MKVSIKNYTFRYLSFWLLIVIAIWALLFRGLILDEVYDNVDDGLKNQKIEIIRHAYIDPTIVKTNEFGLAQFRILPVSVQNYSEFNHFSNELIFMEYDNDMEPYRVMRTGFIGVDKQHYSLEIRTSTVEEDDLIYDLTISLVVLYFFILLSVLVVNSLVLNKAFLPFKKILNQLQQYRVGESKKIDEVDTNVKEFLILQDNFKEMIQRNEEVFKHQKLFIENASHELQTPLAIAINKLDLIFDDESLNENQLTNLADAKNTLWRMVNLNKSLLMLSRIENQQFAEKELVNFTAIVNGYLEDFEAIIEAEEINFKVEISADFLVDFNPSLARIVVSNFIRNAIKHNNFQKEIKISSSENELTFANTSNYTALNTSIIFNRFYKQGNSENSNGLGLSIIDTILKNQSSIILDYTFSDSFHQFSLKKK
jgi:signal transduction histidine kinase